MGSQEDSRRIANRWQWQKDSKRTKIVVKYKINNYIKIIILIIILLKNLSFQLYAILLRTQPSAICSGSLRVDATPGALRVGAITQQKKHPSAAPDG